MSENLPKSVIVPSPLHRAHAQTSLPVASCVAPPAFGVPTCPSLAAKRIQKEWEEITDKGGLAHIPYCLKVDKRDDDLFCWVVSIGRRANGVTAKGTPCQYQAEVLTLDIEFPRNYPFSAPHVTCQRFALFVPRFVPDWTPLMTVKKLLIAVMAKLEFVPFPANHVDLGHNGASEVSFDALGLSCINESPGKVVLLCAKPLARDDRAYWTVTVHQCTEMDIGVATLWEGHNLMQYVWSYLEVGLIQQLLLPEGSRASDGRREKLNSYEYAAEEVCATPCEPFHTGDAIAVFYDGPHQSLSFYRNGTLQHTFRDVFCPGAQTPATLPAAASQRSGSRRGRRERLLSAASDPAAAYPSKTFAPSRRERAWEPVTPPLFPALAMSAKLDNVTFSFEPPLWSPDTHRYYPRAFTRMVPSVLFALEKRRQLSRTLVSAVLSWIGTGFHMIAIPTIADPQGSGV